MIFMPHETTGKKRMNFTVKPVDRPGDNPIRVNVDGVTHCYPELPDGSQH